MPFQYDDRERKRVTETICRVEQHRREEKLKVQRVQLKKRGRKRLKRRTYGAVVWQRESIYLRSTRGRVERRLADRIKTSSDDMLAFGVFATTAAVAAHLSRVQTRNFTAPNKEDDA